MTMAWIWVGMLALSVLFGSINDTLDQVSAAALEGAGAAVTLCISMGGIICLWNGIMEVARRGGLSAGLARLLRPILRRLFPQNRDNNVAMEALSANVSANVLGLGNAATPFGIKAAGAMKQGKTATNDLCMLVVLNTASIQLIPATVAGIRASAGAARPFAILPAVWITSLVSLVVGIGMAKLLSKRSPKHRNSGDTP